MYSTAGCTAAIRRRINVERRIVKRVIQDALKAGYSLSVFDGEEEHPWTRRAGDVYKTIMNVDDDFLRFSKNDGKTILGWVRFVYGNDGWDVISDNTMNLEEVLSGATALSEKLEGKE